MVQERDMGWSGDMIENALIIGVVWGGIAIAITYGCEIKDDWVYNWIKSLFTKGNSRGKEM